MLTGIHQPNFFPWLGFFDRVSRSDSFIFFDHVQRPGGKSWVTRVSVMNQGSETWLTIPIKKKGRTFEKIFEAEFGSDPDILIEDIFNKLRNYYHAAPFKEEIVGFLEGLYVRTNNVADFNINFIVGISRAMEMKATFMRSSQRFHQDVNLYGSDMILETCKRFDVKNFLCGGYAIDNIVDVGRFLQSGVNVIPQAFKHPVYRQNSRGNFFEGLSVLDLLMNQGLDASRALFHERP